MLPNFIEDCNRLRARTPAPFMDPADRRRYTLQHSCWRVYRQGSSSWPLWVDAADLCCLRDLMMMMMTTNRLLPDGAADSARCMGLGTKHVSLNNNNACMRTVRKWFRRNNGHLTVQIWTPADIMSGSDTRNCFESFIRSQIQLTKKVALDKKGQNIGNVSAEQSCPAC